MNAPVQTKKTGIAALIDTPNFASALAIRIGNDAYAKKFVKMLQTTINKVPNLLKCSPHSITVAAYQLAELNLSPIPQHGHAYLIPYKNNKTGEYECQFQLGWRGLCAMAMRDGGVRSIHAEIAYKGDKLLCSQGLEPRLIHELDFECQRNDKNIYAVYAVAHLADGSKIFEIMSKPQIDDIRNQYSQAVKGGRSSPWDSAYGEMARKTVVKRLAKYLPMCETLDEAIEIDNRISGFEERDITDQAEVVEDIKQRVISRQTTRGATVKRVVPTVEGEVLDISDMAPEEPPEQDEEQQPEVEEMKGRFNTGDYQTDVVKAVDMALNEGLMSQKAIDVFCADRNVPQITNLKKEDARALIDDIEKKYANVYKD